MPVLRNPFFYLSLVLAVVVGALLVSVVYADDFKEPTELFPHNPPMGVLKLEGIDVSQGVSGVGDADGHLNRDGVLYLYTGNNDGAGDDVATLAFQRTFNIRDVDGGPRLTIDNNGSVGIGIPTPSNKLHVSGAIGATAWIGAGCETNCSNNAYAIMYPDGNIVAYAGGGGAWNYNQLHFSSGWGAVGVHATIGSGYSSGISAAGIMLGSPHVPWRTGYGAKIRFAGGIEALHYWDWGMNTSGDYFKLLRDDVVKFQVDLSGNMAVAGSMTVNGYMLLRNSSRPSCNSGTEGTVRYSAASTGSNSHGLLEVCWGRYRNPAGQGENDEYIQYEWRAIVN